MNKKQLIENYFLNSELAISVKRLNELFNISETYIYQILRELQDDKKIVKLIGSKIKYYKKWD